ncbi:CD1375 family protein [Paenibacillus sabuli]|nr:CD1375 family protein [Paenibacillus sabuli]
MTAMVLIYVKLIQAGRRTLTSVPPALQADVEQLLQAEQEQE